MTLEEVIDELNLDVTNYFEWEWKETLNESRFLEFRKVLSRLKDLSLDFEDNNCHCEIFPKDDIQLKDEVISKISALDTKSSSIPQIPILIE